MHLLHDFGKQSSKMQKKYSLSLSLSYGVVLSKKIITIIKPEVDLRTCRETLNYSSR